MTPLLILEEIGQEGDSQEWAKDLILDISPRKTLKYSNAQKLKCQIIDRFSNKKWGSTFTSKNDQTGGGV